MPFSCLYTIQISIIENGKVADFAFLVTGKYAIHWEISNGASTKRRIFSNRIALACVRCVDTVLRFIASITCWHTSLLFILEPAHETFFLLNMRQFLFQTIFRHFQWNYRWHFVECQWYRVHTIQGWIDWWFYRTSKASKVRKSCQLRWRA